MKLFIDLTEEKLNSFFEANKPLLSATEEQKEHIKDILAYHSGDYDYSYANTLAKEICKDMPKNSKGKKLTPSQIEKPIINIFGVKNPEFPICTDKKGNIVPDSDLNDTENIPWDMSYDEYMDKEVLPYAPETWIDETVMDSGPLQDGRVGIVGTNISFNKFFYHYEEPRKPEVIAKEIMELESGLEIFMKEFL